MRFAFTLVEMMIAIVLIAMMSLFMYNAGDQLKTTNRIFMLKDRVAERESKLYRLLYLDLMQNRSSIDSNGSREFDILRFTTENSLHNIPRPYVLYLVTKKNDNALLRLESNRPIPSLPFRDEDLYKVKVDMLMQNVERFKVMKGKEGGLLIYLKEKEEPSFMVELKQVNLL